MLLSDIEVIRQWQRGRDSIRINDVENKLSLIQFEPKHRQVKSKFLYRGLANIKNMKDSLIENGIFILPHTRMCSSWTTRPSIATLFAQGFYSKRDKFQWRKRHKNLQKFTIYGLVIKIPTKNLEVLVNLNNLPYKNPYWFQKEVIVKGNGVDIITNRDIIYRTWVNKLHICHYDGDEYILEDDEA